MRKLISFAFSYLLVLSLLVSPARPQGPAHQVLVSQKIAGGSTLSNNIVAAWNFEEASNSTRADAVSTNALTDTFGNVLQSSGKINFGAGFSGGSNQLQIADNAALSITSSQTIACWINFTSVPGAGHYPQLIGKYGSGGAGQNSYLLYYDGDEAKFGYCVSPDGSAQTCVFAATFGTPSTSTDYFVVAYFDDAGDQIGISVTPGSDLLVGPFDTTSFAGPIFDSTSVFQIGRLVSTGDSIDGVIDAAAIFSARKNSSDLSELFNNGNGKQYPY